MTVNIEASASSMPESLDSLRTTPLVMHRIIFRLSSVKVWYDIMREARALYGRNWRSQPNIKRKLDRIKYTQTAVPVWFEVPDLAFATWCAVKLSVDVQSAANK
jgi:hypothetical protein